MTREEAIKRLKEARFTVQPYQYINEALDTAIRALEQEPCEMTAEDYRQRMIQAFHNADCDELIAICVLPTEKEFEHLEWLLKSHYKKEPCEDCISRQAVLEQINCWIGSGEYRYTNATYYLTERVKHISSFNPQKSGWIPVSERLPEDNELVLFSTKTDRVFEGRFFSDNTDRQWYSFCDRTFAWNNVVIAWMPLPEPMKVGEENC